MRQPVKHQFHAFTKHMKKAVNLALLLANGVGVFLYLRNASLSWPIPEEAGLSPGIAGPSLVWVLGALPWMVAFILVDAIWIAFAGSFRKEGMFPLLGAGFWLCAVGYDFSHYWQTYH